MNSVRAALGRRLRLGIIGGGPESFIGSVHRSGAALEEKFATVAGVLSSDPERSRAAGRALGFDDDRAYGSADELFAGEVDRADPIDVLVIATPNDSHYALSRRALEAGLNVVCEKPLCNNLAEALDLIERVRASGAVFCTAYSYTGYPLVRQARAMVRRGDLGEIRMVQVDYVQGHLAELSDGEAGENSNWHMDQRAGPSLILGDIGSHAYHLGEYVSGRRAIKLIADIGATVPGRLVDDYAGVLLNYDNGARGSLWVTQAAAGAEHGLKFRVFGARGGLEWHQENPNKILFTPLGEAARLLSRDGPGMTPAARRANHVAFGHPEGYRESFATLYDDVADAVLARISGRAADPLALDFPGVIDGARGVKFIQAAIRSGRQGAWVDCDLGDEHAG